MTIELYQTLSLRLLAAFLLGGIIGVERDYHAKDAGFRTHFLVSLGAALFTIVSIYGFIGPGTRDSARVAAQVVSGIGFLGAGLIVFQRNAVKGLTTAAGLWVTAAIGMACGVGMIEMAATVTVIILLGLEVVNAYMPRWSHTRLRVSFCSPTREAVNRVIEELNAHDIHVHAYELRDRRTSQGEIFEAAIVLKTKNQKSNDLIMKLLKDFDEVMIAEPE